MKSLASHILEGLQHPEVVKHHLESGIPLNESYLRVDSDSYAEVLVTARRLYESGDWQPANEADRMIVERLSSGDKATYDNDGRKQTVKVDIPMPNPDRNKDGKRFIVYRKSDKEDKETGLPKAKKIKFGSWDGAGGDLDINNDDKDAVKSFWARQNCDSKSDQDSAGWWACYAPELFGDVLKLRGGKARW